LLLQLHLHLQLLRHPWLLVYRRNLLTRQLLLLLASLLRLRRQALLHLWGRLSSSRHLQPGRRHLHTHWRQHWPLLLLLLLLLLLWLHPHAPLLLHHVCHALLPLPCQPGSSSCHRIKRWNDLGGCSRHGYSWSCSSSSSSSSRLRLHQSRLF
jgi:hypothetical protein